ncbi:MAG: hypothetical protein C0401_01800 [Anaerolinea sp.]|nr:hypothetical protein [Anaerolinea sp.]
MDNFFVNRFYRLGTPERFFAPELNLRRGSEGVDEQLGFDKNSTSKTKKGYRCKAEIFSRQVQSPPAGDNSSSLRRGALQKKYT